MFLAPLSGANNTIKSPFRVNILQRVRYKRRRRKFLNYLLKWPGKTDEFFVSAAPSWRKCISAVTLVAPAFPPLSPSPILCSPLFPPPTSSQQHYTTVLSCMEGSHSVNTQWCWIQAKTSPRFELLFDRILSYCSRHHTYIAYIALISPVSLLPRVLHRCLGNRS